MSLLKRRGIKRRDVEGLRVADLGQSVDPFRLESAKIWPGFVLVSFPTTLSLHSELDRSVEFDSCPLRNDSGPSHVDSS